MPSLSLLGLMLGCSFVVALLLLGYGILAVQRGGEDGMAARWGSLSIVAALILILTDCTVLVVISQPDSVAAPSGPRPFTQAP